MELLQLYKQILTKEVVFPNYERHNFGVSPNAQDLIIKLLNNKKNRLGVVNDVQDILSHPFF